MASWFRADSSSQSHQPPPGAGLPSRYDRIPSNPRPAPNYGSDKPPLPRAYTPQQQQMPLNDTFIVVELPSTELALTNRLTFHPSQFGVGSYVVVKRDYVFTVQHDPRIQPGQVGVSMIQRKWMSLAFNDREVITNFDPRHSIGPDHLLGSMTVELQYLKEGKQADPPYDGEQLEELFRRQFDGSIFTLDQPFVFVFSGKNLLATIKALNLMELMAMEKGSSAGKQGRMGVVVGPQTEVSFVKAEGSSIRIKSSSKRAPANAIIQPNFKFEDMGIGGLDAEFSNIFRRAFASRIFPPGLVDKLGIQHVKGILLFGPPGTGKTLMARQIGKMLNAREPKIVNGPEILNKFVGQSEENIRKLFADAEKEYKAKGDESGLHIIIFDELDAICKQRGSQNNGTGVGDSVVNQLLSKMDGVDQLNNILIIGMTNRLDMIDEALLRPGRLEVHMEISLPDENGRLQILKIHTSKMSTNGVMGDDVDIAELANLTKNFSGAEIGGLVKSATSFAFNRHVKGGTSAAISDDVDQLKVMRQDFMMALDEVHPAFGVSEEELAQAVYNGVIHYDENVKTIQNDGTLYVRQVAHSEHTQLLSVLMHGPPGAGKTALAATIAMKSEFPFVKLISPENMVGFDEYQKVAYLNKVFTDSYKSVMSVLVVDNIERILDWVPIGARFSNRVLQALMVLITKKPPKGRRLLVIATTSNKHVLQQMEILDSFQAEIHVRAISQVQALLHVVREMKLFSSQADFVRFQQLLQSAGFTQEDKFVIGVKKLLSLIELARQDTNPGDRLLNGLLAHVGSDEL